MLEQIKQIYRTIPHADKISPEHLKSWLKQVNEIEPSRLLWHMKRARGVGGSEIGTLLLEASGLTPPFERTSQLLANEKLFITAPTAPLPHMMTGIILESAVRQAIISLYGGERDLAAEQAVSHIQSPLHGALVGNTDFYWNLKGSRILTDIKVPINSTDTDFDQSQNYKLLTYEAQLHLYDMLGESVGIHSDKMVVAELDVPTPLAEAWKHLILKRKKGR